ncbi:hypothetical protein F511_42014 [Dorcoceras hygrometricum]|uniref:Uncharacterized protein n=1 Tax=Dorcoceras hygrometricum TaxID=472368 RepID=A0A2Z7DBW7_9LAMI|nr:hypothetical protein F511_42014 [Dorcoceras hygrometricum]
MAAPLLSSKASRRRPPPKRRRPPPPHVDRTCSDHYLEEFPSVLISSGLLVQADEGTFLPIMDLIRRNLPPPTVKSQSPCDSGWSQAPVASEDMVTPTTKQDNGFAPQICALLKGAPDLTVGEAKTFPPLKILTAKTVGTYVAKNKNITSEEETDEPQVEKMVEKAVAKRIQAPAVAEPTEKKKRTTMGRAAPTEKSFALVPVATEAEPISIVPAASPSARRRRASKRKFVLQESDKEVSVEEIVSKVIAAEMEIEEMESRIDVSSITNYDEVISFKVLSNEEGPLLETPLSKVLERTETTLSDEESISIGDILKQILEAMMLPSIMAEEPTKIKFGHGIQIRERDWYKASLPQIYAADKGKEPLVDKEEIKGHPVKEMFTLICADIEFLVQIREAVIEEIVSFFHSFSLRRLAVLDSVSDIAAKEDHMLQLLSALVEVARISLGARLSDRNIFEYTTEDKKKANLVNVARDILYKTLDKNMFNKIKICATTKEIWEKLTQICEGPQREEGPYMIRGPIEKMIEKYLLQRRETRTGRIQTRRLHLAAPHPVIVSQKRFTTKRPTKLRMMRYFYFSNIEFTREDFINTLNEMVHEYRKLSQTFEEVKAENNGLKNSTVESSTAQLEDTDSLKTELSKLMIENESLRNKYCELTSENERLNHVMSSWTKSSVSLGKLHETQNPLNAKSGLGFSVGESSSGETSTQSDLSYDKFKKMNLVKASVAHDTCESVKYDDQISPKLNYKGKAGIAYTRPENNKPSWLKKRLDKDKAKSGSKSSIPNQQRRGSTKAKSIWVKVQPQRNLNDQSAKKSCQASCST